MYFMQMIMKDVKLMKGKEVVQAWLHPETIKIVDE